MVKRVKIRVKPNDMRRKLSGIQIAFERLGGDLMESMSDYLNEYVKRDMIKRMEGWDTSLSPNGIKSGFVVERKAREVRLKNVKKYAEPLITGVREHGPVYIGDWAERNNIESLRRPDGSYSQFTEVGGQKSRIKLNNSRRDFWTPVIQKHFGTGLVNGYLKEEIERKFTKRIKKV